MPCTIDLCADNARAFNRFALFALVEKDAMQLTPGGADSTDDMRLLASLENKQRLELNALTKLTQQQVLSSHNNRYLS